MKLLYQILKYLSKDIIILRIGIASVSCLALSLIWRLISKNKEIKKIKKTLKEHTFIDPLTELHNYKYFLHQLKRTLSQAQRNNFPVSLIKIDIDLFKNINKIYGSLKGDIILKEFSNFLKKNLRSSDIITRLEDDEFGIVCSYTDKKKALKFSQRLKENLNLHLFGKEKISLQISIGLVTYPDDGTSEETLLSLLDRCLEYSKERRNKVITLKELRSNENKEAVPEKTNISLLQDLKDKISELKKMLDKTTLEVIVAFANTIKAKDLYTAEHTEKTVEIAVDIAKELNLDNFQIEAVRYAAMLHDLGKVGVPESILTKPGKLTEEEFKEIKKHPIIGSEILRPLHSLSQLIPPILYHHERIDGKGYPYGLKGDQIPVEAKIVALADSFQALTSDRSYRKAYSLKEAKKIIEEETGSHFDPEIVEAFNKNLSN